MNNEEFRKKLIDVLSGIKSDLSTIAYNSNRLCQYHENTTQIKPYPSIKENGLA